jgi:hypothetical protein
MQQEANGVVQLEKNLSEGYRNFSQSMEQWKDDPNVVQQDGSGLTKKFVSTYDDWSNQLVEQQTLPRLKRMAAERVTAMGDHFFNQASQYEIGTNRAWRVGSWHDTLNTNGSTIQQNPDLYDSMLKSTLESLDAMRGLHPSDYFQLKSKAVNTYSEAASLGLADKVPQYVVNLLTGQQPLPSGSVQQKIQTAATNKGLDPKIALAVQHLENPKGDPNLPNQAGNAGVVGLYQMDEGTWKANGGTDANRMDPDAQVDVGTTNLARNTSALQKFIGHEPTPGEVYSTQWGLGFAKALAKAPDDMPIAQVFAKAGMEPSKIPVALVQNNVTGLGAGQVRARMDSWMAGAMNATAGAASAPMSATDAPKQELPEYLKQLTPQGREAILTHAQTNLRKDEAGAKAIIAKRDDDAQTAYENGSAPADVPTLDDRVKAGIPLGLAQIQQNKLTEWQQYGAIVAKFNTMTPDERQTQVEGLAPKSGEIDYANKAHIYNTAISAMQKIGQAQRADQMAFDQGNGLKLSTALDLSKPDVFTVQMGHRWGQAEQVATNAQLPYKPVSDNEAFQIAQRLSGESTATAMADLAQIRASAPSAQHFSALMQQVAPKQPLVAMAGQAAQSDPDLASRILEGAKIRAAGGKTEGGAKIELPGEGKFNMQWAQDMGDAFNGLPEESVRHLDAAIAVYATLNPKVGSKNEIDPDAWKKARDMVAPTTLYLNNRTVLVPPGMDPSRFNDTIAQRWEPTIQSYGGDPKDFPQASFGLVPKGGQDGVYLATSGTGLLTVGGKQVEIDLNLPMPQPQSPPVTDRKPFKGRQITAQDLRMFTKGR